MKKIILASSSPRRKQLLKQIGLEFVVDSSDIDEILNPRYKPRKQVEELSRQKAEAIAVKYDDAIIIAADTMIALGDEVLGKPTDEKSARKMLQKLSGKSHSIITGMTIIDTKSKRSTTLSVETIIYFQKLTPKEITNYIRLAKPFDKAGSYAIQDRGAIFIKRLEGDYFSSVGLPLFHLAKELKKLGIEVL